MDTFFSIFSKEIKEMGLLVALEKYLPVLSKYAPNVMTDPEDPDFEPQGIPGALPKDTLEGNLRRHLFGEKSRIELAGKRFKAK